MPAATFVSVNQDCFGFKRDEIVRMSVQEFQDTCLAEESREVLRKECERVQLEQTRSHWFRIIAKHPAKKQQFHYDTLGGKASYGGSGVTVDARLQQNPSQWITASGYLPTALFATADSPGASP